MPANTLFNQIPDTVRVKEETIELSLSELATGAFIAFQTQEGSEAGVSKPRFATQVATNSTLPLIKQEVDNDALDAQKRWISSKAWLSELWKTLPAVPSLNSRRAWANARGFVPATVNGWFANKKATYKRNNPRAGVHPQQGYELPVDEPRESLLVSFTPPPVLQPTLLDHTSALGASSSPLPQTPYDLEPLANSVIVWEASPSGTEPKSTKRQRKMKAPTKAPLFSLTPGVCPGQISVPAQPITVEPSMEPPPPAKRGGKRKVAPVVDSNTHEPAKPKNAAKRRKVKAAADDNGTCQAVASAPMSIPPMARIYKFKMGQGEPKATRKDLDLAAPMLFRLVEYLKPQVDSVIPSELHQSMKSYPPPPFFLDLAKDVKQLPRVPTSLDFPPHSLASMLYTSSLIAPFLVDGASSGHPTPPTGCSMDWFAPPRENSICLETQSKQSPCSFSTASSLDLFNGSAPDTPIVRASHEVNSELGLWDPEVEALPWKSASEMEVDLETEWP